MAIGLGMRIVRSSDETPGGDPVVEKVFYFATRRRGDAGVALRKRLSDYQDAQLVVGKSYSRHEYMSARLGVVDPASDEYLRLVDECESLLEQIVTAKRAAVEAAHEVALCSLKENYGAEKAAEIVDQMTDAEIAASITLIETGQAPADFFVSPGQREKQTSTPPSEDTPLEPSSPTDTI